MFEAQRRHRSHAKLASGEQPAMPGDDPALAIDQDRHVEAKNPDAVGDLPHLRLCRRGFDGSGLSVSIARKTIAIGAAAGRPIGSPL